MYDVWIHVIPSIIKLHTVMFKILKIQCTFKYKYTNKTDVRSLPWHSGKVSESIGSKSSRCRQFETHEERK